MAIFECKAKFILYENNNEEIDKGECVIKLEEKEFNVLPKLGESLLITYRDIITFAENNYKIYLNLNSKEKLTIFDIGYLYDDFVRIFSNIRNEMILKDLLMYESIKKTGFEGNFIFYDENGEEKFKGECKPRLYETGIVIIPEKGELIRIPYSDLSKILEEDYSLILTTDYGEKIVFSMLGDKFDSFVDALSNISSELQTKVQSYLKELLPIENSLIIRKSARFMKEGKAARRKDIESISPELWKELEKKVNIFGIKKEYEFLKKISKKDRICIGLKRGLMGDLTGEYIWFLIPVNSENLGNAIAMEATSEEGSGKATYFFRIASRKEYKKLTPDEMDNKIDLFIMTINRCMLAINFRREPIYLPDEKLDESRYQKYRYAIQKIPSLRILRNLFIGRVIHSSPEQWQQDVTNLLYFNTNSQDNKEKWEKKK